MINIKRLHEVHYLYPNVPRRFGKTTYCYDRLLRTAQLGTVEEQFYITNTQRDAHTAFKDFMHFLSDMEEKISYSLKDFTVFIGKCEIKFISLAGKERLKGNYNYFTEDYY